VILCGYFPKLIATRPEWLAEPTVEDVCSVSKCVSPGPDDWVDQWRHNLLGWFNTVTDARSVVPANDVSRYRLFAYRLPSFYRQGHPEPVRLPRDVSAEPLPPGFVSLGFDVYSNSMDSILGPECSPLSCNSMASEFHVNRHCLLATLDEARDAAATFSVEHPEPGDYYVAEVLEAAARAPEQGGKADRSTRG
jgi:hypothetical protein